MTSDSAPRDSEHHRIIREASAVSFATYAFQFIALLRGIVIARVLGPSLYGFWSLLKVFLQSPAYLSLGVHQGMTRQIPFLEGQGEYQKKHLVRQNALSWTILTALITAAITLLLSFTSLISDFKVEIRWAALVVILNSIHIFIPHQLRSEQRVYELSRFYLFYGALNTLFGLSLLFILGITGLLIGMLLSTVLLIAYLKKQGILSFEFSLHREHLISLFRVGFPVFLVVFAVPLMSHIDKLVVFLMLGSEKTGLYALAAFFSTAINHIPQAITTVLLPRMMFRLGNNVDPGELQHFFGQPLLFMSTIVPLLLGLIIINIDWFVTRLVPEYTPSLPVLKILVFSLFFTSILAIPKNILISFNKQSVLIYWIPPLLITGVLANIAVIKLGFDLIGIAVATTLLFFVVATALIQYALVLFKKSLREQLITHCETCGPLLYAMAMLYITQLLVATDSESLLASVLQSLVFLLLNIPTLVYLQRKTRVLSRFRVAFQRR